MAGYQGIFTPGEIRFCSAALNPVHQYAACFAAKEAAMKALGVQANDLALFREVEVGHGSGQGYDLILRDRLKVASERLGVTVHQALHDSERQPSRRHRNTGRLKT